MSALDHPLVTAAATFLGTSVTSARALHGGDLSEVIRLTLEGGGEAVVKSGPAPPVEAEMLRALGRAGAPVPEVLVVSCEALVLTLLEDGGGLDRAGWQALGAALRQLHDTPGDSFGWPEDYAFATLHIRNAPCANWPAFWAERRLLPELSHLPPEAARRLERLAADLPNRLPDPAPGLLHGDLWAGNLVAAHGRLSGLIDPACYHGHGEVDLAMLSLFGSPGPGFAAGYGPPEPGADERRPLYQLWPAIVHYRLFGAGYAGLLDRLLAAAGA